MSGWCGARVLGGVRDPLGARVWILSVVLSSWRGWFGLGLLGVLLAVGLASAETFIRCQSTRDGPAIQAALNAGGAIRLEGTCGVATGLTAPLAKTLLMGPASLVLGGPLTITGTTVTIQDLVLWTPGIGVVAGSGTRIERAQINSGGHGLVASGGSGLWLRSVHFNGTPGANTSAVLLGWNVTGGAPGWDSAWVTDTLIEAHDTGVRLGGPDGATCNIWLSGLVIDRVKWIGLHVEPWGRGFVCNVQAVNLWMGGRAPEGLAPILLNATQTQMSDSVRNFLISQGYFSHFTQRFVWVAGNVSGVVTSALVWN